jgi:hypothetical protein
VTTTLTDHVCEHPACAAQTVWPEEAARRGWFVITDRHGHIRVICPAHNNARRI